MSFGNMNNYFENAYATPLAQDLSTVEHFLLDTEVINWFHAPLFQSRSRMNEAPLQPQFHPSRSNSSTISTNSTFSGGYRRMPGGNVGLASGSALDAESPPHPTPSLDHARYLGRGMLAHPNTRPRETTDSPSSIPTQPHRHASTSQLPSQSWAKPGHCGSVASWSYDHDATFTTSGTRKDLVPSIPSSSSVRLDGHYASIPSPIHAHERSSPLLFDTITKEECLSSGGKRVATTNKRLAQRAKALAKGRTHSLISARPGGGRDRFRLERIGGDNILSHENEGTEETSGGNTEVTAHAAKTYNNERVFQCARPPYKSLPEKRAYEERTSDEENRIAKGTREFLVEVNGECKAIWKGDVLAEYIRFLGRTAPKKPVAEGIRMTDNERVNSVRNYKKACIRALEKIPEIGDLRNHDARGRKLFIKEIWQMVEESVRRRRLE